MEIPSDYLKVLDLVSTDPDKYFHPLVTHADNGCEECTKKLNYRYCEKLNRAHHSSLNRKEEDHEKRLMSFYLDRVANYPEASGYSAFYIGWFYKNGRGVCARDYKEAIKYYEIGAKQGNPKCILELANIETMKAHNCERYENEGKALQHYGKARKYYEILVELGSRYGMKRLGDLYSRGQTKSNIDFNKAIEYYEMAAKAGSGAAAECLLQLYANVKIKSIFNLEKAIYYGEKADEMDNDDGRETLCDLYLSNNDYQNFARAEFHYKKHNGWVDKDAYSHWHTYGLKNLYKYIPSDGYRNYYQALEFYYSDPKGYKLLRNLIDKIMESHILGCYIGCNSKETIVGMFRIIGKMDLKKIYGDDEVLGGLQFTIDHFQQARFDPKDN